jgi:hypothetical protein
MARQKGPGAIKFLDATQDEVAMRNILWRGDDNLLVYERKLNELYTKAAQLAVQQMQLDATIDAEGGITGRLSKMPDRLRRLRAMRNAQSNITLERAKAERRLRSVETALRNINKQIEKTLGEMPRSRREKAACGWQEMAVRLIMERKMIHAEILTEGEFVLGTKGAIISTKLLQQLLRACGFRVEERQLRRFIHDRCEVMAQQGKGNDLTSDNK